MSGNFNGRDALAELDRLVARTRQSLAEALSAADTGEARQTAIQREQAEAYAALADLRLGLMNAGEAAETFGRIGVTAGDIAERHAAFVETERRALETAAADVQAKEEARAELAAAYDAAIAAYEARVSEAEATLRQGAEYANLTGAAEEARAMTLRAAQKLEIARADREEKGKPYRDDTLFSYLWKRKFRSPEYKAPPVIRMLDGWVAKLCRYDQAFLNYQRLTELPERIAEHAAYMARLADEAEAKLVEAEARAMEDAGTGLLKTESDRIKAAMGACDLEMEAAEARHREMAERHEAALRQEAGPAVEARRLLETELRKASFPDLRLLAAETAELDDDRIVDRLVRLRTEEMSLELEAGRMTARPAALRDELGRAEALRRQFKQARFDSPYAVVFKSAFDEVVSDLMRDKLDVRGALQRLSRSVRRAEAPSEAHPDFGGQGRSQTIGLPDVLGGMIGGVLGEVLEEVIRETTRGGGGYGSGPIFPGPPKRTSRPSRSGGRSFPSGRGRKGGGGFKTGGGF
ncbi:hypothetical protein HNE_0236 [Hyphomonas neptunium ATCC 15444]|uniref:Uncharacterized protein n=2 Tax=Hyphomonas TaxID=85 RepID=Q0C5M6_HYPNA|nr:MULTISPECIES: hypothetical protein [Hyphomonas]ABI76078.1 hypothetical protein HNE_0236 [Hyphomonas neptunium ATCC 15444]KCZ95395.1 hypothetical protein HHI_04545 [Hyphomonas hirschiana VP5]